MNKTIIIYNSINKLPLNEKNIFNKSGHSISVNWCKSHIEFKENIYNKSGLSISINWCKSHIDRPITVGELFIRSDKKRFIIKSRATSFVQQSLSEVGYEVTYCQNDLFY